MTDTQAIAEGRVARVVGPVVDVEFPPDRIPPLYNALTVEVNLAGQGEGESSFTMTLEVAQHLGDNLVRTIALKPTDGLVRGAPVTDTGAPISVPVGDVTKGHVFNVTGDVLNLEEGETLDVKERWPIHRQPPAFDQLEARIHNVLLQSAASELASRQRAMHTATDNAQELITKYTRLANSARQAEITQEITEIVGGADALGAS